MKLLTIMQAFALLLLAVFGATAGSQAAGDCPSLQGPSIVCDDLSGQPSGSGSGGSDLR